VVKQAPAALRGSTFGPALRPRSDTEHAFTSPVHASCSTRRLRRRQACHRQALVRQPTLAVHMTCTSSAIRTGASERTGREVPDLHMRRAWPGLRPRRLAASDRNRPQSFVGLAFSGVTVAASNRSSPKGTAAAAAHWSRGHSLPAIEIGSCARPPAFSSGQSAASERRRTEAHRPSLLPCGHGGTCGE
jgi:hypothetical protein